MSASNAASSRALTSLRKFFRSPSVAPCEASAASAALAASALLAASVMPGPSPWAARRSFSFWARCARIACARRSARASKAARAAAVALMSSGLSMRPARGRSISANSAPRGSEAIWAIEFRFGPRPNRCSASAASRRESSFVFSSCAMETVRRFLPQSGNEVAPGFEFDGGTVEVVAHRFEPAAQMFGEKHLRHSRERTPVLRPAEAVSLVGIMDVGERDAARLHGRDDLLRLRRLHPHVVRALPDQQRAHDPADVIKRRAFLQKLLPRLGRVVAHAHLPQGLPWLPIVGDGAHESEKVGTPA